MIQSIKETLKNNIYTILFFALTFSLGLYFISKLAAQ